MNCPGNDPIELAPAKELKTGEIMFQGYGHGHFSYLPGKGFHATTNIPGFGEAEGLPNGLQHHDDVAP